MASLIQFNMWMLVICVVSVIAYGALPSPAKRGEPGSALMRFNRSAAFLIAVISGVLLIVGWIGWSALHLLLAQN